MSDISQSALSLAPSPSLSDIATGLVSGASKNMQLQAIKKLFDTLQINSQTGNYTIQESDHGKAIEINSSYAVTVTVPNSFFNGFNCLVVQIGTGAVTLSPAAGVTLRGNTSLTGANASAFLYQRGTNDFVSFTSNAGGTIVGGFPTANRVGFWKEADMVKSGGIVTSWPETTGNGKNFTGVTGSEPTDAGADGLSGNGSKQMTITSFNVNAFTLYAWVKLSGTGEMLGTSSNGYVINFDTAVTQTRPHGIAGGYQTNSSAVATGAWKVVALVVTGGTNPCLLYVDGALVGSFDAADLGAPPFSIVNLFGEGSPYNFKGSIKRLALFNANHSGSEVSANSTAFII